MKFIAILKDSLRETIDFKIFYVMVALSLLTVGLVLSVTYKPVPLEKQLDFIFSLRNMALRQNPVLRKMNYRLDVENFERTDSRSEPWLGNYTFDLVIRWNLDLGGVPLTPEQANELKRAREELRRNLPVESLRKGLKQQFQEVKLTELPRKKDLAEGSEEIVYHVVTSGGTTVKSRQEWPHEPALFFGLVPIPIPVIPLYKIVEFIGTTIIGGFGAAFTLVISIIITAWFLPNMLTKGTIDLLLVKPIHRVSLFSYKFLGGLLFMFINTAVIMTGIWLAIGIQAGTWVGALLVCVFIYTFQFAIIYSVSALMAVWTRSIIVCILVSFMTWGFLFALGWAHWFLIEKGRADAPPEKKSHWAFVGFDTFYTISPRYKDIDWLTDKMIEEELIKLRDEPPPASGDATGLAEYKVRQERAKETYKKQLESIDKRFGSYNWTSSLTVTSLFIFVMLGLACWRFSVKDY